MDLQELTDEQLDQHRKNVLIEQERRQALAEIPDQIAELAKKYVDGGGNIEDLPLT